MSTELNVTSSEPPAIHLARLGAAGAGSGLRFDTSDSSRVLITDLVVSAESPRAGGADQTHVHALAESEVPLPPIVVHRATMRVIDGVHRLRAAVLRRESSIDAYFFDGTVEDAFVLAVELNAVHGLPLTRAERAAATTRIIDSHPHWSDRTIGTICGISGKTVASIRRRSAERSSPVAVRIGRDGRVRPVSSAQGRRKASELIAEKPDASISEIAADAGIALSTAYDVRRRLRDGENPVPVQQRARAGHRHDRSPHAVRPTDRDGGRAVGDRIERRQTVAFLGSLRADPSFRGTEAGRTVLRLLDLHFLWQGGIKQLVDVIPPHSSGLVAQAARECADMWLGIAKCLEQRVRTFESDRSAIVDARHPA